MDKERQRNTSLLLSPEVWRPVSSCCALDMVLGAMDLTCKYSLKGPLSLSSGELSSLKYLDLGMTSKKKNCKTWELVPSALTPPSPFFDVPTLKKFEVGICISYSLIFILYLSLLCFFTHLLKF